MDSSLELGWDQKDRCGVFGISFLGHFLMCEASFQEGDFKPAKFEDDGVHLGILYVDIMVIE